MSSNNGRAGGVILGIAGVKGDRCAISIVSALSKVSGVSEIDMDLEDRRVVVDGQASPSDLIAAVERLGFSAYEIGSRPADEPGQDQDGDRTTGDRS